MGKFQIHNILVYYLGNLQNKRINNIFTLSIVGIKYE